MLGIGTVRAWLQASRAEADLRRVSAEKRAEVIQAYDAARVGGRMAGWSRPHTSAATELQGALPFLRAGARDLVRNSPFASRAVRVVASHVAGSGVRPRLADEIAGLEAREALQRITRDQWERFQENCDPEGQMDFYGQQRLVMRTVAEGGEALRLWFPVSDRGRLFWRCRIVEGDLLDHQRNEDLPGGGRVVQGVEFDALGRRVAYHLFEGHPGDSYAATGWKQTTRRVSAEYVDHIFEVLRPGQVRGVSWFAPVATVLRDLDDLAEAEVVRKKLEACISMVVHNAHEDAAPDGAAIAPATGDAAVPLRSASGSPIERMQPGMVLEARPGWGVEFNAPPASPGLVEHMKERLHAVAAGIGVTYMQMTGDMSRANYSSMREGRIEFNRLVDSWQADLMVQQSGRPAWRRVMQAASINGELTTRLTPRAKYIAPKRPWVDPQKDVSAAVLEIENFIADPEAVIEATGKTPEEVMAGQKRWRGMRAGIAGETPTGTGDEA
ncbi:phage portal protein [Sagittula stellata]|uniref:Phage portal protein, lambda n=1 Tax=Sagittula stellata (strain ATCC 700073 / DSM 11524 / E-37) TaxID=388399 RepID=A3K1Z6_SAGS3|nr:phage portal protein [Sagittula stellata]EBA08942.1 Phage portal protein, lambda [Sagittula stellata E-37]